MKPRDHAAIALPAAAVGLALALAHAPCALAQDSAQRAEVAVTSAAADVPRQNTKILRTTRTGSNILRTRTDDSLPLLELDRGYIERSGATTAPELLRTVPQIQIRR